FSFLIKLLYIIHQKTPRTVKKKTEAPQVDVEGLSFPSYFRYSKSIYFRSNWQIHRSIGRYPTEKCKNIKKNQKNLGVSQVSFV
ncbi:hypothetical protein MKA58_14360, partial [[Clostridium] innocuum]|nr:hypothetical protein [[Clostridium] innocuum]